MSKAEKMLNEMGFNKVYFGNQILYQHYIDSKESHVIKFTVYENGLFDFEAYKIINIPNIVELNLPLNMSSELFAVIVEKAKELSQRNEREQSK